MAYAGPTPPTGWLWADGALVSRATYAELFAVIGETYGAGNGTTTFKLPDLSGRMPAGKAAVAPGPAPDDTAVARLGGTGGTWNHVPTATFADSTFSFSIPNHTHALNALNSHSHTYGPRSTGGVAAGKPAISGGTLTLVSTCAPGCSPGWATSSPNGAQTPTATVRETATLAAANPPYQVVRFMLRATPTAAKPSCLLVAAGFSAAAGYTRANGTSASGSAANCLAADYGGLLPDIRKRFPIGKTATGTLAVLGGSGGSFNHQHSAAISYPGPSVTVSATTHTVAVPDHPHGIATPGSGGVVGFGGDFFSIYSVDMSPGGGATVTSSAAGGGTYTASSDGPSSLSSSAANPAFQTLDYFLLGDPADELVPGGVVPYAGADVPAGWLRADGSCYSRSDYPDLFDAVGYAYGGINDSFCLPDLRARFPLGKADDPSPPPGTDAAAATRLGGTGGVFGHVHTVSLPAHHYRLVPPNHTHTWTIPDHQHRVWFTGGGQNAGGVATFDMGGWRPPDCTGDVCGTNDWSTLAAAQTVGDQGGGGGTIDSNLAGGQNVTTSRENPPFLALNFLIATGAPRDELRADTLHANGAELKWPKFSDPSGAPFQSYEIHRSTNADFIPSPTTLLATINDVAVTSYRDARAAPQATFTYLVLTNAVQSTRVTVTLPADGGASKLLQPGPGEGQQTYINTPAGDCRNHGAESQLRIGTDSGIRRPLLAFDIRDIPSDATITSAKLSLWHVSTMSFNATVDLHRVSTSWRAGTGKGTCSGDGATWEDATTGVKWRNAGGDYAIVNPPLATVTNPVGEAPGWDDFDVTTLVRDWVRGGAPNLGVLLKLRDDHIIDGNGFAYQADDIVSAPQYRPQLLVTYTDGSHAQRPQVALASPGPAELVRATVVMNAAASDDRRVEKVEFLVDGALVGTDTTDPFATSWDSRTATNAAHTLSAKAYDDAGNVTTSATTSVTVANYTPPTVSLTAPATGSTVSGAVTISANAAAEAGIDRVEFYMDDLRLEPADTVAPYSISWDTVTSLGSAVPAYDGPHVLTAKAYDPSGQFTKSATTNVTVANAAGTKYIAAFSSTAPPQSVIYDPAAPTQDRYGLDVTVTNGSGVTWSAADIVLRYRWVSPDAVPVYTNGPEVLLGADLAPNAQRTVSLLVEPPALAEGTNKAQYRLRVDAYERSSTTWFAAKGSKPLEHAVVVNKALNTGLGLERYYHYQGEQLGAGMQHLVNVASGNSIVRWTPFAAPGRGLATVVELTYNSLEATPGSPAGNGFSLATSTLTALGLPLDVHPNRADELAGRNARWIAFTDGDGTTHRFEGRTAADASVYWVEPSGIHLYLREYSTTDPARRWALTRPDRVTFFYAGNGYPTSVEDANGNRLDFTLEAVPAGESSGAAKRITTITDAAGLGANPAADRKFTITYYSLAEAAKPQVAGRIKRIKDHTGSALDFDYYEDGNLLRITQRGGTNADGSYLPDRSFVFTYTNTAGDGPAIADPAARANPSPHTANQSTRLYGVRDPRGNETTFAYQTSAATRWRLASRTDRAGAATSFGYDLTTRVTTVTAPLARVSRYGYDADGKVTAITNPKSETTNLSWNADCHVTRVTEPSGVFTQYVYNDNGYLTATVDQLSNRTEFEYENLTVDGNDISGKWQTARSIPHLSQLAKKTAPKGVATATPTDDYQWQFGYDLKGNLTSARDPLGHVSSLAYNADGTVATATDANNHTTTVVAYDPNGLVAELRDARGQTTRFGYDSGGLLQWIQDPLHAAYSGGDSRQYRSYFSYDSFGRLGRQSTPKSTAFAPGELIWSGAAFDANDNVTLAIGPHYGAEYTGSGAQTTTSYDTMDRATLATAADTSVDPLGERTQYLYDAAGRVTRVTSPKGVQTTSSDNDFALFYDYDQLDRAVRATRHEVNGAGAITRTRTTHFCFDLAGDMRWVVAPKAAVATVDCSAATPPAYTTRYEYDAAHRLVAQVDPLEHRRSLTYDANGNVASVTDAAGTTETRSYNQLDQVISVVAPFDPSRTPVRELTTRYEYDSVGNLKRLIAPRAWDASADKTTFTDYVTVYQYDELDRLVRSDLPAAAGTTQAYVHNAYDQNGNLRWTSLPTTSSTAAGVDESSKNVVEYWDPGWIRTSKDPANPRVHFDYTAEGWQAARTPEGTSGDLDLSRRMLWCYYRDGLLKDLKDPGGQGTSYNYDANGNFVAATEASGLTTSGQVPLDIAASYDGFDHLVKARQRRSGVTNYRFTSYSYDLNGNVVQREENGEETPAGSLVTPGRKHDFTYDQADWFQTQLDFGTDPGSADDQRLTVSFWPTGLSKQRTIAASDGAGGWATKQVTDWVHFANGELKTLTTKDGTGSILEQHTVTYEDANGNYLNGNRTKDVFTKVGTITDPLAPCSSGPCTATYSYDARERLVSEADGHGTTLTYALDPAGNVTTETKTGAEQSTRTMEYVGLQLRKVTEGTNVERHFYDALGNLDCVTTGAGTQADCSPPAGATPSANLLEDYSYDYRDRLAAAKSFAASVEASSSIYAYDPFDRPVEETERQGAGGSPKTTLFTYVGLSTNVSKEQRKNETGSVLNEKTYAYDAFDRRIGMTNTPSGQPTERYTFAFDVHGSVSLLLNQAGAARAAYGYRAYGAKDTGLTSGDTSANDPLNPYRYTAKRLDSGSGTIDMGARRFSPDTGRYLQQDLYHGATASFGLGLDPLTQNRYGFAAGNPLGYVETDGHRFVPDGSGGGYSQPRPSPSDAPLPPVQMPRFIDLPRPSLPPTQTVHHPRLPSSPSPPPTSAPSPPPVQDPEPTAVGYEVGSEGDAARSLAARDLVPVSVLPAGDPEGPHHWQFNRSVAGTAVFYQYVGRLRIQRRLPGRIRLFANLWFNGSSSILSMGIERGLAENPAAILSPVLSWNCVGCELYSGFYEGSHFSHQKRDPTVPQHDIGRYHYVLAWTFGTILNYKGQLLVSQVLSTVSMKVPEFRCRRDPTAMPGAKGVTCAYED